MGLFPLGYRNYYLVSTYGLCMLIAFYLSQSVCLSLMRMNKSDCQGFYPPQAGMKGASMTLPQSLVDWCWMNENKGNVLPLDDASEDSHCILRLVHKGWNQVPSITINNKKNTHTHTFTNELITLKVWLGEASLEFPELRNFIKSWMH